MTNPTVLDQTNRNRTPLGRDVQSRAMPNETAQNSTALAAEAMNDDAGATNASVGYGQYCPISRALELLGERWSLLILRDLVLGSTRFNDLARGLPGLSRSLLAKRLRQFERAELVRKTGAHYVLTDSGRDLEPILFGLAEWGAKWTFGEPDATELDPDVLVWWMHTRLDTSGLPGQRQVFAVRFTDDPRRYWIVVDRGAPSVCVTDPGFDVDATIVSDVSSLYQVWLGRIPILHALRSGRLTFTGPSALTRRMPDILRLSPVAPYFATPLHAEASA